MATPIPPVPSGASSPSSRLVEAIVGLGSTLRGRRGPQLSELLAEYERVLNDPPQRVESVDDPHFEMLMEIRKRKLESQLRFENALCFVVLFGAAVWLVIGLGIAWERLLG
jgi:hypothetical protein